MTDDMYDFEKFTSLDEYERFVTSLASPESMKDMRARLATGALGLAGEVGEVTDIVKKILFHGMEYTEEVRRKLVSEVGDCMWYIAFMSANVLETSVQEVIDKNVEKLQSRYKSGQFTTEEALAKERLKTD